MENKDAAIAMQILQLQKYVAIRNHSLNLSKLFITLINLSLNKTEYMANQLDKNSPKKQSFLSKVFDRTSNESLRLSKLQQIAQQSNPPTLILKVLNSTVISKGTILKIVPQGLINSKRGGLDGYTYFGSKRKGERDIKGSRGEIVNDFVIPSHDFELSKKHRGRHFMIYFSVEQMCYRIKDLGLGFGVFYKLDKPLKLKDNHLLNLGLIFIVVNFTDNLIDQETNVVDITQQSNQENLHLKLNIFGGPYNGETHLFEAGSQQITLGRSKDCTVELEDNLLSKFQCQISHVNNRDWILTDGKDKKPSTNGTWIYLGVEEQIVSGMILKANQTVLQAQLI